MKPSTKSHQFVSWPQVDWRPINPGKMAAKSTPLRIERRMFGKHIYTDYDEQARFYTA